MGTAGQKIQFQSSGSTFPNVYEGWRLEKPDGTTLFSSSKANAFFDVTTLPASGTYRFFIDPGAADVGSVNVKVWSVPEHDANAGSFTIDGPALAVGNQAAGQNAWATIEGTAGQKIQFQSSGSTFPNVYEGWRLEKPDGTTLFSSSKANAFFDVTTLPATGTYRFFIDPGSADVGSVNLKAWDVTTDVDGGSFTVDGPALAVGNQAAGQNAWATIVGTAGQKIQFQSSGSTFPNAYEGWRLEKPDGTTLFSSSKANAFFDVTTLPATGTYRFFIDPGGADVGSVNLKTWSVPADVDGGSLSLDGPARTLTTTTGGQNAWMTMQGTTGQRIQFQTNGNTYPNAYEAWRLEKPDGATLFSSSKATAFFDVTTLPATGTYRFFIDPGGPDTGSVNVKTWTVPADVDGGSLVIDGPAKTLTTTVGGQNASMTMQGTAGQRIQFQTSGSTYPNAYEAWRLEKPDGTVLFSSSRANASISATTLPATGTYRFYIDPGAADVGSLIVRAWTAP